MSKKKYKHWKIETSNDEMPLNWSHKPTHLIAFWDGKSSGTKHMIEIAQMKGIPVWVFEY